MATKSGHKTYGLGRFFSSLYGKLVAALSFFNLSLISVKERTSYPVMMEQVVKEEGEKPGKKKSDKKIPKQARKRGHPKGSKNKNRREVELTPLFATNPNNAQKPCWCCLGLTLWQCLWLTFRWP